jgi:N-methylhydantoinase B
MMTKPRENLSPVTLSVLWNSFISVADEMGTTLRHTAFSEAVREAEDFSTGVFDRTGRLVAQGNFTPGHLGAMPFVVQNVLKFFPEGTLRPGDGVLLNDSALGSGHFPDCFLVTPVFIGEELIGYVVNTAHHVDMGGAAPGSQKVQGVTEAYQEGVRILPVRLVRDGEFDEDILRLILGNIRLPDLVRGDLSAQRNANFIGAQRLTKLFKEYGREQIDTAVETIFEKSETRMRDLIRKIPDGTYSFQDQLDDCGPGDGIVTVAVDITVKGDDITADFSRSSDQVSVAINSYLSYTRAYTLFAVKVFADALLPQNDGAIRPITATSREGRFSNPRFPAPCGGRAALQIRIFDVINGARSQALPDRAMGAFSHWSNPNIGGIDDRTGKPFIFYDLILGGYGARSNKDGAEALSPVMNCANIPVEVHETNSPIVVRRVELIADSGGPGQYRGGCAIRKDVELRTGSAVMTLLSDRHGSAGFGLFGGAAGTIAETILNPDGDAVRLTSKEVRTLKHGDVVSFRLNGAGGYGPIAKRSRKSIEDDVADGYVTSAFAEGAYEFKPK